MSIGCPRSFRPASVSLRDRNIAQGRGGDLFWTCKGPQRETAGRFLGPYVAVPRTNYVPDTAVVERKVNAAY